MAKAERPWQPKSGPGTPCTGGKVLLGLDTQRGFGAGQREVTMVAALCPLSCLATCFPLGVALRAGGQQELGTQHRQEVTPSAHRDARGRQRGVACVKSPCPGTGNDIGTAQQGSQAPPGSVRRQSQDPIPCGCHFAPPFSSPSSCPTHTGVFWNVDTDPCQSQLGAINMPGLKGAGCESRAPCPALPGTPCAGAAWGSALPGLWCSPRRELWHPGDSRGCGAAMALPARCQVWVKTGVCV